jgi:hypothetical protein
MTRAQARSKLSQIDMNEDEMIVDPRLRKLA